MPPDLEAKLRAYEALIRRWSPAINLVSRADLAQIWSRHIQDSLALIPHIPADTTHAIDLGSGAGFPGLVLALATGIPFTLIEADKRKAAFLVDAARQLAAPATILAHRIESATPIPAPLVTARALAPLDKLLTLAHPHLTPSGTCLFPKGETALTEILAAQRHWQMTLICHPSPSTPASQILKLTHLHPI